MRFTLRDWLWLCLVLTMGYCWWLETSPPDLPDQFWVEAEYIKEGGGS
jgi:hypothetical protein